MAYIVATEHLTKEYGGRTVVEDLNLRVPQGSVYGFLGPNGSGKSTTMKMLLSLIRPSSGEVQVMGEPMTRATRRTQLSRIGSLIESPPGYAHLTGRENMRIIQRLLGLNDQQIDFAIQTVRMQGQMDKKVRNYSLGMKQRLGIAMALARQPKLLILDEPTNGLDPAGIEEIRDLLRRLADGGVTVMVSSHLLGEIDKTATTLGILSGGRMIFQGTRDQLFSAATPDVLIRCSDPARANSLLAHSQDSRIDEHAVRVPGIEEKATAGVIASLVHEGIGIYEVRRDEQTLEQVFMSLTEGGGL
ncbi:MAG: ABC transporter ATP-binding protein [Micrococcaceae bacterium]